MSFGSLVQLSRVRSEHGVFEVSFAIIVLWRQCSRRLHVPWWLQHHVLLYALLGMAIAFHLLFDMLFLVLESNYLKSSVDSLDLQELLEWEAEASLATWPCLRVFTLLSPLFLVGTFIVCANHTARIARHLTGNEDVDFKCNATIWIISLPLIYGVMSTQALGYMWEVVVDGPTYMKNGTVPLIHVVRAFNTEFESKLGLADAYEAVVMWIFGALMLDLVDEQMAMLKEDLEEGHGSAVDHSFVQKIGGFTRGQRHLAITGIRYFCIICILTALLSNLRGEMHYVPTRWQVELRRYLDAGVSEQVDLFLQGAGFFCSFVAIEHLVIVEREHHDLLDDQRQFNTFEKFLSVKVMVSIVFMQGCAKYFLPSSWTTTRKQIFHGSGLVFECFLLSLFHTRAWNVSEPWYGRQRTIGRSSYFAGVRQLSREDQHVSTSGAI